MAGVTGQVATNSIYQIQCFGIKNLTFEQGPIAMLPRGPYAFFSFKSQSGHMIIIVIQISSQQASRSSKASELPGNVEQGKQTRGTK